MPDTPLLYDDLTVRQHLELVTLSHGAGDAVDEWLGRLDLAARAGFLPRELSRGMRQKTMLACALVRPARVLLLDEPVVGLDPPSQSLLREVRATGTGGGGRAPHHAPARVGRRARRSGPSCSTRSGGRRGPWAEVRERAEARGWTQP